MASRPSIETRHVPGFCPLCVSRCGSIATVEDGRFVRLTANPDHPTGKALCIKGKVAPELVYSPQRLRAPLKRTKPKGAADPSWKEISWDEALNIVAERLKRIADEHGPESVVFATASPSTAATSDVTHWIQRLQRAYGSPNYLTSMELCGWGRYLASLYTYGAGVPGAYMPDIERAGCLLYWGYNPTVARIAHATATTEALARGAKLVVIDPRNVGVARQAHEWLRVRPGTDGALALAIIGVMIERGWYDRDFVLNWTNGPLLVRADNGRLLKADDLDPSDKTGAYVGWDENMQEPVTYEPRTRRFAAGDASPALSGEFTVKTASGTVTCATAFELRGAFVSAMPDRALRIPQACRWNRWSARPACSLNRVRSPTIPGVVSSSTQTRHRPFAPSGSFMRSPAISTGPAATCSFQPFLRTMCRALSCWAMTSVGNRWALRLVRSVPRGSNSHPPVTFIPPPLKYAVPRTRPGRLRGEPAHV